MQPGQPPDIRGLEYSSTLSSRPHATVFVYAGPISRSFAVKVFAPGSTKRFDAELRAAITIGSHPNIGEVVSDGLTPDGRPYLVMPYHPYSFVAFLSSTYPDGRAFVADVLRVGVKIAGALDTLHRRGMLHRDVKPSNILLTTLGEPVLIDFDIALGVAEPAEVFAPLTEPWSAPEVLSGASPGSPQSDVYSLAATLWTALVGHQPSPGPGDQGGWWRELREALDVQFGSAAPADRVLEVGLVGALARDPDRRPDATGFALLLNAAERALGLRPTEPVLGGDVLSLQASSDPLPAGPPAAVRPTQDSPATRPGQPFTPPATGSTKGPPTFDPTEVTGAAARPPTPFLPSQAPAPAYGGPAAGPAPPARAGRRWSLDLPGRHAPARRRIHGWHQGDEQPRVSTGFQRPGPLRRPVPPTRPLRPGRRYEFWLEIGNPAAWSIETGVWHLPVERLPPDAVLDVVVHPLHGDIDIDGTTQRQRLILHPDGSATVPDARRGDTSARARRLRFRVRMPVGIAAASLRCSIYHQQVLLQSRVISIQLGRRGQAMAGALRADVDYSVTPALDPGYVASLSPHTVSIFMNDDDAGTHGFYFCGAQDFDRVARISERDLDDLCVQARDALRRASWGSTAEWTPDAVYRYGDGTPRHEHLAEDLIDLARTGARLWDKLVPHASGSATSDRPQQVEADLRTLMRAPGRIQLVRRTDLDLVVPVALVYDYPLDDPLSDARVCADGLTALRQLTPDDLVQHRCFRGDCPNYAALDVVCVGGFWGFRHEIGLPISIGVDAAAVPPSEWIDYGPVGPTITTGFSSDTALIRRTLHRDTLHVLRSPVGWFTTEQAHELVELCKSTDPHLVYLLCHGGVTTDNTAFLEVGAPGGAYLTPHTFRRHGVDWRRTRPLVMVNGCNTAALTPTRQLEFVNTLVRYCSAAGVIGTEVTVFEDLACDFAEELLGRALAQGQPLGVAMRGARLALLVRGNPLGLAYVAHASAGVTYRASS